MNINNPNMGFKSHYFDAKSGNFHKRTSCHNSETSLHRWIPSLSTSVYDDLQKLVQSVQMIVQLYYKNIICILYSENFVDLYSFERIW